MIVRFATLDDPAGLFGGTPRRFQSSGVPVVHDLAAVGRVLVARGDTRRAYHVASAACAVGQWTKVLGLVLSLESSAIRVLTEVQ